MGNPSEPAPLGGAAHFNYTRVRRDRAGGIIYALCWAACIVGGLYAVSHRSRALSQGNFEDPSSCPLEPKNGHRRLTEGEPGSTDIPPLAGPWLAVPALLAWGWGVAFILLFKHRPELMTKAALGCHVLVPTVMAVVFAVNGMTGGALASAGTAAFLGLLIYMWRGHVGLATRLLGVAAHALSANAVIIPATIGLSILAMVAISPLSVFIFFAGLNGELIPNPQRQGSLQCIDAMGKEVLCCSFQSNTFSQVYIGCATVVMLWTSLLANQIKVYVTAGAVAQWYFAPSGSPYSPLSAMRLSFQHALGPSYGSLCFSSLVLTIAQLVRRALDNASRATGGRLDLGVLIKALSIGLGQCFVSILGWITKFATIMMAITGESFVAAGRHATDLLLRNMLDAFASTIWFTPLVIISACFTMSACWALLNSGAYYYVHSSPALDAAPVVNSILLGLLVFLMTFCVLIFFAGILLSVLDAVFICWAIDRDSQTVSHPEVYSVFQTVPMPGAVVEQPDGIISYGAGEVALSYQELPTAPNTYQPPVPLTASHV